MSEDYRAYIDLDNKRVRISTRRACMVGEDLKKGCYYGFAVSSKDPTIYGKNLISRKYVTTTDKKSPPMVYGIDEEVGENLDKVTKTKPQDVTIIEELKTGGAKKKELKKLNVKIKEAKQSVKGKEIKAKKTTTKKTTTKKTTTKKETIKKETKKPKKELSRSQKDKRNAKARERYRIKQKPKREAKCKEWLK